MSSPMNDMASYTERLNTFEIGEEHGLDHQTSETLAEAGFYYTGSGKSVTCFKCQLNFVEWNSVHEVIDEHNERSPDCCRGIQESDVNQCLNRNEAGCNQAESTARRPQFGDLGGLSERLNTFHHWQYSHRFKPIDLAEAGLFSIVHGDRVRCFYCGCELRVWQFTDAPLVEHLRRFPECDFARNIQTNMSVGGLSNTIQLPSTIDGDEEHQTTNGHAEIGLPQIPTFEQMRAESNENVYSLKLRDLERRIDEETKLRKELEQSCEEYRCQYLCIICYENRRDTLFLPCSHVVTCETCASELIDNKCCYCRSPIHKRDRVCLP